MDLIRQWIVGVTCAAIIGALAECLMPEGGVKKAGRLAVGLLLMLAVVKPLSALQGGEWDELPYSRQVETGSGALQAENEALVKAIIEERTAAYISDKAEALGMECTVQVSYHYGGDGDVWPESVVVRGEFTQRQQESLSQALEADLAIRAENQTFERVVDQ